MEPQDTVSDIIQRGDWNKARNICAPLGECSGQMLPIHLIYDIIQMCLAKTGRKEAAKRQL